MFKGDQQLKIYLANEGRLLGQFRIALLATGLGGEFGVLGGGDVLDDQQCLAALGALLKLENAETGQYLGQCGFYAINCQIITHVSDVDKC